MYRISLMVHDGQSRYHGQKREQKKDTARAHDRCPVNQRSSTKCKGKENQRAGSKRQWNTCKMAVTGLFLFLFQFLDKLCHFGISWQATTNHRITRKREEMHEDEWFCNVVRQLIIPSLFPVVLDSVGFSVLWSLFSTCISWAIFSLFNSLSDLLFFKPTFVTTFRGLDFQPSVQEM